MLPFGGKPSNVLWWRSLSAIFVFTFVIVVVIPDFPDINFRWWTSVFVYLSCQSDLKQRKMGNSIKPHIEHAEKTGACNLGSQGLTEVRLDCVTFV